MIDRTLQCESCDSEYTIEYDEEAVVGKDCYCPFCGHLYDFDSLFEEEEEETNDLWDDE